MLRKIIICATLFFMTHISCGQHFGIKAGLNYSNLVPDPDQKYGDFKTGLHFGVFSTFRITEVIYLRPEIHYSQKGYSLELPPGGIADGLTSHMSYLTVPIAIEIQAIKKLSLHLGTELGYLLSVKEDPELPGSENPIDTWNRSDVGLLAGFNFQITEKIQCDFRYVYGLSSVSKTSSFSRNNLQNRLLQVSVGYKLL
ncbi:porin family protein [Fulvivirga sp.]|uniref:porin family protein n=1 Tax=Fulvivirga sp. TaxID=1931237 RepID=UPI0032EEC297